MRFGEFTLDISERLLTKGGLPVHLTPKALALLQYLVENGHRAVAKAELLEHVWPSTVVSEASLTSVVKELRRILGDSATSPRFVRGVRGFGYAFCAEVQLEPTPRGTPVRTAANLPLEFRVSWQRREVALAEGDNLLGRVHEAAVWVEHPSVSRHHAVIRIADDGATLEDCGSKNGTFLNGTRIQGPCELCSGDVIGLGQVRLQLSAFRVDASTESHDRAAEKGHEEPPSRPRGGRPGTGSSAH